MMKTMKNDKSVAFESLTVTIKNKGHHIDLTYWKQTTYDYQPKFI